jgi:hemerythrin-like metal-binding protein
MAFLQWTTTLPMGDPGLDADHQQLIEYINELHAVVTAGGGDGLQELLAKLVRYTHQHFTREEAFLRAAGYPGLAEHVQQHQEMMSRVNDFARRIGEADPQPGVELYLFLSNWLATHVRQADMAAAEFVRAKKEGR